MRRVWLLPMSCLMLAGPLIVLAAAADPARDEKAHGTLTAKGDIWLDITADGQKAPSRYYLLPPGYRMDANGTKFVRDLKIGCEMEVTWYWLNGNREVRKVNVGAAQDSDGFVGTVIDKTSPDKVAKTLPYLEVRDDGGKTERFAPHWVGGGVDKDMLAALLARNRGDRVEIHSVKDDHLRAHTFRVLSITPDLLAQASDQYGVITGTVADKGKDWISIKPDTGEPQRLVPQRIVGAKEQLDAEVLATIAAAKPGERVEAAWIKDGERRIIGLIRIPPPLTAAQMSNMQVSMPPQAIGFRGTLLVRLVKPVANACFTIQVVKVESFSEGNRTHLNPSALTDAWKGAFAWCGPGKNAAALAPLKVGGIIALDCYQNEMHLRYTRATKVEDAAPSGK